MYKNNFYQETLWNDEYLLPAMQDWEVGIVLCTYDRCTFTKSRHLATIWANKVDRRFGRFSQCQRSESKNRLRKVLCSDYGEDRRGWHINVVVEQPQNINQTLFLSTLEKLWLETLALNKKQREKLEENYQSTNLFWGAEIAGGFRSYAIRNRTKWSAEYSYISDPNDLLLLMACNF